VPVLGAVQQDPALEIVERHLGLVPSQEADGALRTVQRLADAVRQQVDLQRLCELTRVTGAADSAETSAATEAAPLRFGAEAASEATPAEAAAAPQASTSPLVVSSPSPAATPPTVRIGVAMDRAFGFYYADDLRALREAGAQLVALDTLHDRVLPPLDGLFLGGGFPETSAAQLSSNGALRQALHRAIVEDGLPTYAECGGLMFLARSLRTLDGQEHPMVGVIPADVVMHRRPVGRGYVRLRPTGAEPWSAVSGDAEAAERATRVLGHEFHYSSLENLDPSAPVRWAWAVERGHGIDGRHDGLLIHRLWAQYSHLRSVGDCAWANAFVNHVRHLRHHRCLREERGAVPALGSQDWCDRMGDGAREAPLPPSFLC
jgi:cobyrinic acid a,c-diamide synthase